MEGDYKVSKIAKYLQKSEFYPQLCMDNTMSTWAEKVVWLEITIHDPTADDYYEDYIGITNIPGTGTVPTPPNTTATLSKL